MSQDLRSRSFNNTQPAVIIQLPAEEFIYADIPLDEEYVDADDRTAVTELRTLSEP